MEESQQNPSKTTDFITCLLAGFLPQERRTVCFPIAVPFKPCNASSALFLVMGKIAASNLTDVVKLRLYP
jgi:hypothetical protein